MTARLVATTVVRHPGTGMPVVLAAGDPVPGWADLGDHLIEATGPPAKAGPGSSRKAWAAYAVAHDVEIPDGMSRDDIIAVLADAGVRTD